MMYFALTVKLSCTASIVNMAALLTIYTKEHRAVISFLWDEGVTKFRNSSQGINTVERTVLTQWSMYVQNSRTCIADENEQGSRPHRRLKGELNKYTPLWLLITEGRLLMKWQPSYRLVTVLPTKSSTTDFSSLFLKDCVRWVLKQLDEHGKRKCLDISNRLLGWCHEEGDTFVSHFH
jgi:hypothetical protein